MLSVLSVRGYGTVPRAMISPVVDFQCRRGRGAARWQTLSLTGFEHPCLT